MNIKIIWCVTGAGHFLLETLEAMIKLVNTYDVKVTTALSKAGVQVAKIFGIWDKLKLVSPGRYYEEILTDESEGACSVRAGRLLRGKYDVVIVSPASANTIAKITRGIADTLVTNIVAQADKANIPILIIPTDQKPETVSITPHVVDRDLCNACGLCLNSCPYNAITMVEGKAYIFLTRCYGCGICLNVCPEGAISFGRKIVVKTREIDLENVERLRKMKGFIVLEDPNQIIPWLKKSFKLSEK